MSALQKLIIGGLIAVACLTFALLVSAAIFWVKPGPVAPVSLVEAAPSRPSDTAAPPTATPALTTSTATPPPTPVATRVVVSTPAPTPSPTPSNCINHVLNFAASGALDDAQVRQFLAQTIPANHLDYCRRIEYVHKLAAAHGTAIAGNFIPVDRKIFVYAFSLQGQRPQELLDTLIHEIGHNVFFNQWRQDFKFEQRWIQLHNNEAGFVSDYARFNYMEDFAESYRAYITAPAVLQQVSAAKYQFMRDEVFAGLEYQ